MKKILYILVAVAFALSLLAGCSGGNPTPEAPEELATEQLLAEKTEQFVARLIDASPEKVARGYFEQSYAPLSGSALFRLKNACVLYSGGAVFAVADINLYPAYTASGKAQIPEERFYKAVDLEVVRSANTGYALLYEPGSRPNEGVVDTFLSLSGEDEAPPPAGAKRGKLKNFIYNFGDGWTGTQAYEVMALDLMEEDAEGRALGYLRVNDRVLEGYPVELPASKLEELEALVETYGLISWEGDHQPDQEITDGSGYYLILQYENARVVSSGYMVYPDGYDEGHQAILAFFGEISAEVDAARAAERKAWQLQNIAGIHSLSFSFGNHLEPESAWEYSITRESDAFFLSVQADGQWVVENREIGAEEERAVLDLFEGHGVFAWDGFEERGDNQEDYIYFNCIFVDTEDRSLHMSVQALGCAPEGYEAFYAEFSEYMAPFLGSSSS